MDSPTNAFRTILQKHKFITAILVIALALLGWYVTSNTLPHPLGSKMDYLGKHDFGALFYAADKPYSVYYYGTNVPPQNITQYFTNTTLEHPIEYRGSYAHVWLLYKDEHINITYEKFRPSDIKSTDKKYLITLTNSSYDILKKIAR